MKLTREELWARFQENYHEFLKIGLAIDVSRMNFTSDFLSSIEPPMAKAFEAMTALEGGAIANPDEGRMVGHYWLRNPELSPTQEIRASIEETLTSIKDFTTKVHTQAIQGANGSFKNLLVIGIGGSALGPQFVSHSLGNPSEDKMSVFFFDNSDPDGIDYVLDSIGDGLGATLCVVISKSGGTKETRNGMLEAKAAYEKAGLKFESHAVAVTGENSQLDKVAVTDHWLSRFPMWDWVGGRTSELSAVGLLPAALQGIDIDQMLAGAHACDQVTRITELQKNPSALLAAMWYSAGNGKGSKDMVILPYKDRLVLFSRYLQQLLMESLGKELDLNGDIVNQGIAVYGNKGSTDQHAYVQQLRDGLNNFFVTFIEVLRDRKGQALMVESNVTSGDYLSGFFQGTRQALYENERESITITINDVTPFSVGVMIALYERAVGLYASLTNLNAYHQPGVEAGKKAAASVIDTQLGVLSFLADRKGQPMTCSEIANGMNSINDSETVFKVCEHLAANPDRGVRRIPGATPFQAQYALQ